MAATRRHKENNTWADYIDFRAGKSNTPAYDSRGYIFLGGCVGRIEYDAQTRTGKAHMVSGHCVDGPSVIRFFKQIDPGVRFIETFSGGGKDTSYDIAEDGTVRAYLRKGQ